MRQLAAAIGDATVVWAITDLIVHDAEVLNPHRQQLPDQEQDKYPVSGAIG
jgi:hypothetical protein